MAASNDYSVEGVWWESHILDSDVYRTADSLMAASNDYSVEGVWYTKTSV